MSSPLLTKKLAYVDEHNPIEEVVNDMAKILNALKVNTFDDYLPIGTVILSSMAEKDFMKTFSNKWVISGNTTIGSITVNIYIKTN